MAKVLWYYQQSGEEGGPVSSADLRRMAARGELAPQDKVRRENMQDWVEAQRLQGVEFQTATPPTVAPAVAPAKSKSKPVRKQESESDKHAFHDIGEVAGILRRWGAAVIDSAIFLVLAFAGSFLGMIVCSSLLSSDVFDKLAAVEPDVEDPLAATEQMMTLIQDNMNELIAPLAVIFGCMILLPFLYELIFESSPLKGTLGKIIFRTEISRTDGDPPGFLRILARTFLKFILVYTLFIGAVTILFTRKRQAMHDMICGTVVVMK
ncbi:RDD family protein [Polystyrenella longa]|uniref:RDD family protein n=1 Tax=Polystyrenella longa TaxID=2528007 RepID=A0A518CH24_9PLAN|nr:RDD family protein [Polystyrenella longa]QDU78529.1 RDD family protein [Polystyrenella longa]